MSEGEARPGAGLVVTLAAALVATLLASAAIAAASPDPSPKAAPRGPTKDVTSTTGKFSLSIPAGFEVKGDIETDEENLFFSASAGDGYRNFTEEGVSILFLPVQPGSSTSPDSSADLRQSMDSLSGNADRCDPASVHTDNDAEAVPPPPDDFDHTDWEWTGCPNGWVERNFAFFEPTGRYGVIIAARAQNSAPARGLVTQVVDSLQVRN